jgi:hypothetical protein
MQFPGNSRYMQQYTIYKSINGREGLLTGTIQQYGNENPRIEEYISGDHTLFDMGHDNQSGLLMLGGPTPFASQTRWVVFGDKSCPVCRQTEALIKLFDKPDIIAYFDLRDSFYGTFRRINASLPIPPTRPYVYQIDRKGMVVSGPFQSDKVREVIDAARSSQRY